MGLLEKKVRPYRATKAADVAKWPWWQFWRIRAELYEAIQDLDRVLVINCGACPHMGFAYANSKSVFAHSLDVFTLSDFGAFCSLQSRPHEVWARFFASSMKDDLRYTPSDCFETFPFPPDYETNPILKEAGQVYHEFRAALMVRNNEGLTKTYNRFHDPDERSADILRLRELHAAMDRAMLDAYGWSDVRPTCEFLLDYEGEDDDAEEAQLGRRRKKPYRLRWPDPVRDDVLARLLQLNRGRAEAESRASAIGSMDGPTSPKGRAKSSSRGRTRKTTAGAADQPGLGDMLESVEGAG